jgi:hypothetical protein
LNQWPSLGWRLFPLYGMYRLSIGFFTLVRLSLGPGSRTNRLLLVRVFENARRRRVL